MAATKSRMSLGADPHARMARTTVGSAGVLMGIVLAQAGVLAGCTPPRMATPADLAQVADEIPVTDRSRASGLFVNEAFTVGPYKVIRVHRGAISTESGGWHVGDIGSEKANHKGFYDFDLKAAAGMYKGQCGMAASEKATSYSGFVLSGSASGGLDCNCSGGGPGVTRLIVDLERNDGVLIERNGSTAPIVGVWTSEKGGGGGFLGRPFGYEVGGNLHLGAVDIMRTGRVWINRALDAGARAELACMFVGVLLYRPSDMQGP